MVAKLSSAGVEGFLKDIEQEAKDYLATREEATLIIGLSVAGERHIRSFRSPDAKHAVLPDAESMYEIGSVSKVFSCTILATLEDQGLIGLDDPISKHLPNSLRLPAEIGSITIRQLATHSSGLGSVGKLHQELIDDEMRGTEPPFGAYAHYIRYRKEHLYADLETAELVYPTGQGWLYSVIGMGTLGHILELVTGKPYEQLLKETICEPLGLANTGYTLSPEQRGRMVFAFYDDGQPCPNWHHDVMLSQGGLRSNLNDLLTFAEANIKASVDGDGSTLSKALRRARELHFECPEGWVVPVTGETPDFDQGLGWRALDRPEGRAWWHGGTTLFYLAGCGVDAQAEVGIGVLESYRKGLGNHVMFHQLQRDWFDRACL